MTIKDIARESGVAVGTVSPLFCGDLSSFSVPAGSHSGKHGNHRSTCNELRLLDSALLPIHYVLSHPEYRTTL